MSKPMSNQMRPFFNTRSDGRVELQIRQYMGKFQDRAAAEAAYAAWQAGEPVRPLPRKKHKKRADAGKPKPPRVSTAAGGKKRKDRPEPKGYIYVHPPVDRIAMMKMIARRLA